MFTTRLTSREVEVIELIAEGHANKQIAAELDISIKTVEKHRQRLMEKLRVHDTASVTRYAIAARLRESSLQLTIVGHPEARIMRDAAKRSKTSVQ